MNDLEMQKFVEDNPTRVNDRDDTGCTLLVAASNQSSTAFVKWLVDEKGLDVYCHTAFWFSPPHVASSAATLSFLLDRGADATAVSGEGWTPLIAQAAFLRIGCVECLLREPAVIATIDTQSTDVFPGGRPAGTSALHACARVEDGTMEDKTGIIKRLLDAGANPTLKDALGCTPRDLIWQRYPVNFDAIDLLLNRSLPTVGLPQERRPWKNEPDIQVAVLDCVLRGGNEGGAGGLSSDAFTVLIDMISPRWSRNVAGGEGAVQG